jgi:hypothetical protein
VVAECVREPLVPITVSVYVPPAFALQETVAVPDPVKVVGLIVPHVSPDGTLSVRETVPVKPFSDVIVMVEVADWPALTAAGVEAVTVKSAWFAVNVAIAEWVREPLVPVTVSV